jgi:hypothetical protein
MFKVFLAFAKREICATLNYVINSSSVAGKKLEDNFTLVPITQNNSN